ncbi:hypothetical protein F2Q68_00039819 [Brassica cretica]|uniref:Uncharacterized protein n=1 Tax=Brassica cretica TaxID=69181 RepID=A0A8S9M927_BRACR|nr:hypothetical protein F2Q68_00039819 [Brassica cretica]
MPKIDDARLNALRPKPKPSENPPEIVRTPSDDGVDPMEVDRVPTGRTLRKRKEKVAKHLKRGANEKEKESFRKRVFRISLDKPFDEAYFTHRLRKEESVDSSPEEWENDYYNPIMATHNMHTEEYDEDYEEERAIEQRAILDEEDTLLHHSSWKKKLPSIDRYGSTSIDTQPHQPNHLRASTDIAYFPSIDTNADATRDGDYSIGSWADDRYHESYAAETEYRGQGADELHEDEFGIFRDPDGYAKAIDGRTLHVPREDIADILQTANGADNLFMHQRNIPEHQQEFTKEFYDTVGGIDKRFKQRSRHLTRPSIDVDIPTSVDIRPKFGRRAFDLFGTRKFYWEENDEYGIYRDDQGYGRDLDGHAICVHRKDIRRLLERASRDEPNYICLPEHASSFTQTKLVPEIYTKDDNNEMFYGVCGEQEKNKEAF